MARSKASLGRIFGRGLEHCLDLKIGHEKVSFRPYFRP
jgi:hypothetical protein